MPIIEARALERRFTTHRKAHGAWGALRGLLWPDCREVVAVAGIDLDVEPGEIIALIGPNGAGKSTMIKMLTGILTPTAGGARVLDMVPWEERERLAFHIGTVFGQKSQLWYHLPPVETFHLLSRIYEMDHRAYVRRLAQLTRLFELHDVLRTPTRHLSLGQRMRAEVAASLLHGPRLVFLDEPTIGLDVVARRVIREHILALNAEEGLTVFLTSHDVGDIERLSTRCLVIHEGRLVLDTTVRQLKAGWLHRRRIVLTLAEPLAPRPLGEGVTWSVDGLTVTLDVDTNLARVEEVVAAVLRDASVADITIADPPLEDVIAHVFGRGAGQAAP